MKYFVLLCIATILAFQPLRVNSQDLPAYRIFQKNGEASDFTAMLQSTRGMQVVLFGELHNNPIVHWLQLELTQKIAAELQNNIVLGMEMFERDDQLKIDEYFKGLIAERNFKQEARLWENYESNYRPLLEFARENSIRLVATNIPRRYAAMVSRGGFEALNQLDAEALEYIAPLPIEYDAELPGYKAMLEMGGAHQGENLPKAQAVKDATMAYFILENMVQDGIFIHFNGTYHSNNDEGIVWYLRKSNPELKIFTIASVEQENTEILEEKNIGIADFILVIPEGFSNR